MKMIVYVIKKIVMALCMLYSFNLIVGVTGVIIPINYCSITLVSCLGLPGIFGLLIISNFM